MQFVLFIRSTGIDVFHRNKLLRPGIGGGGVCGKLSSSGRRYPQLFEDVRFFPGTGGCGFRLVLSCESTGGMTIDGSTGSSSRVSSLSWYALGRFVILSAGELDKPLFCRF